MTARPAIALDERETQTVLPDFLLIGAMKAATSSVSAWLEDHDQVFMVAGQDPNYFNRDEVWAKGPDWYGALFDGARPGQLRGEGTNNYSSGALFPETPTRMAATCPDARLIYMVREPVSRIFSHWVQVRADQGDRVAADPDTAVRAEPDRFVAPSFYWRQLNRYRAYFPDERIWIGFMEDMQTDPDGFFRGLAEFLEIAPQPPGAHRNPSAGKRVPGRGWSRLRRVPGARALGRLASPSFKRAVRDRFFARPLAEAPRLSPDLAAELRAGFAEDSAALLAHCGRPADFWSRER